MGRLNRADRSSLMAGALHWCVWVWLLLAQGASLLLFSAGFFLTRLELGEESGCDPRPLLEPLGAIDLAKVHRPLARQLTCLTQRS